MNPNDWFWLTFNGEEFESEPEPNDWTLTGNSEANPATNFKVQMIASCGCSNISDAFAKFKPLLEQQQCQSDTVFDAAAVCPRQNDVLILLLSFVRGFIPVYCNAIRMGIIP